MKSLSSPFGLPGYEHLPLYWREKWHCYGVSITQGDYCVTDQEIVITTVLGSCISVCLFDEELAIGGINHFMLPQKDSDEDVDRPLRYGLFAMEQMLNQFIKKGIAKESLQVKVIGGARMMGNMSHIGQLNSDFIMQYITEEKLNVVAEDLGGDQGRKLAFFPKTGRLLVSKIPQIENSQLLAKESASFNQSEQLNIQHGVELF